MNQFLYRLRNPNPDPVGRTISVLTAEGLLSAIVMNLATAYTTMFAFRMGATDQQVGLISSLPQLFALIVLIPGALLVSRLNDRRRPVEIALLLAGFFYGLVGFSPYLGNIRVWCLIGLVSLANAPVALYNTTWQSYFSDIIPVNRRNTAYARRTSMTFIAGILVIQFAGIILSSARTDQIRIVLYQVSYWLAFAFSIVQLLVLRRAPLQGAEPAASTTWRDLGKALREIRLAKPFLAFCAVSLLMHAGWYFAWPLCFLTYVNYLGADEVWQSYFAVATSLVVWLTVRPWSKFIERHGLRFTLIIGCLGMALTPALTVAAAYLPAGWGLPVLLVINVLTGITFSAFQLTILLCLLEVIPPRFKTLNLSFYTTLLLAANTVMPFLGVQFYSWLGSDLRAMTLAMGLASVSRFAGAGLFYLRWRRLRQEPDLGIRV